MRRRRATTLEEEAWRARALVASVGGPRQKPLTQLGAALFNAHRAASQADKFLGRVDRKGLVRRAGLQREAAVISARASDEAVRLEGRISSVDRLLESRQALAELAEEVKSKLDESLEERGIASLRERIVAATAELEEALAQATRMLDPVSFKLQRTRHRGVYRSGSKYVVPFVDSVGIDRQREFSTRAEARAFRETIQHDAARSSSRCAVRRWYATLTADATSARGRRSAASSWAPSATRRRRHRRAEAAK